jgi:2-iminobutanoate/2-iminopropanoate deaminase
MRTPITNPDAASLAPYSHAIDSGGTVYVSGQVPIDSATGSLIDGDVGARTQKCFDNMVGVLDAGGLTLDNVVKVTVFLTDMADFAAVNEVYKDQFTAPYPARSCVAVAQLPLGSNIEIEAIAQR